MTPEQISTLLSRLEQIIFLLQASLVGLGLIGGVLTMQFIIHAKNQKHLF